MKLIGLIGKARVGKDTVALHLRTKHQHTTIAFADPMKQMLDQAFLGVDFYHGDREAPIDWLGKSPRQLMQTLGTEWGRNCVHPELWVLLTERRIREVQRVGRRSVVVTDIRFHNEAAMILRNGGELWHIERAGVTTVNAHVSEDCDWSGYKRTVIDNNETLRDLYFVIDHLASL